MSAMIRVSGARLDVDSILSRTKLKPNQVWRRGERIVFGPRKGERQAHSGFSIVASDAAFDQFALQIRRTLQYLKRHHADLRRVGREKGVTVLCLDFGIEWKSTFTHTDSFPAPLVKMAGSLGMSIDISHYSVHTSTLRDDPRAAKPAARRRRR
jgi:hypothetical protein